MVLNSEFWEALTGNQRRKFAKANCEATYKNAILYQILAAVLGMLVVGLFLPIGDKARRYFKGYYSLREEEMPVTVKILCVMDFVFGLFASLVIMITADDDDYGLFVNTLSRSRLEEMLNEPEVSQAAVGVSGDPFRITNFSDPALKKREPKPARRGCEKFDALWLIVINIATVILFIVFYSLIAGAFGGDDSEGSKVPSVDITSQVVSVIELPSKEDFGELSRYPESVEEPVEMLVNTDKLRLRKGPTTNDDKLLEMPLNARIKVYNSTEVKDWYFIAYNKSKTEVVYGWACAVSGNDKYIIPIAEEESSEAVSSEPTVSESTLSDEEVKAAIINHINAINDVENAFVGYLKLSEANLDTSTPAETLEFGTVGDVAVYRKATNVKTPDELNTYLSKYMITSLAKEKSTLPVATDKSVTQTDKTIYYDNDDGRGIYVHSEAMSYAELDASSISVLSAKANAYVVTATAKDGDEAFNYNITFQYKDGKFMVSTYTVS